MIKLPKDNLNKKYSMYVNMRYHKTRLLYGDELGKCDIEDIETRRKKTFGAKRQVDLKDFEEKLFEYRCGTCPTCGGQLALNGTCTICGEIHKESQHLEAKSIPVMR